MMRQNLNVWPLLLDNYFHGLAAVYSLRLLKSSFKNSPILTLRRLNDNATTNVFFDSSGVVSTSSPVSSGGPKLSNWAGANGVTVVTWFDQSGNGNNATAPSAAFEPAIMSSGVINTQNSKPSIRFNGGGPSTLNAPNSSSISLDSTLSCLTVASFTDLSSVRTLYDKRGPASTYKGTTFFGDSSGNINFQWNNNSLNGVSKSASLAINTLYSLSIYATESSSYDFWKKTTDLGSGALAGSGSSVNTNPLMIGGHVDTLGFYLQGWISEFMMFNNVLTTTQRNVIINNQAAYFGL